MCGHAARGNIEAHFSLDTPATSPCTCFPYTHPADSLTDAAALGSDSDVPGPDTVADVTPIDAVPTDDANACTTSKDTRSHSGGASWQWQCEHHRPTRVAATDPAPFGSASSAAARLAANALDKTPVAAALATSAMTLDALFTAAYSRIGHKTIGVRFSVCSREWRKYAHITHRDAQGARARRHWEERHDNVGPQRHLRLTRDGREQCRSERICREVCRVQCELEGACAARRGRPIDISGGNEAASGGGRRRRSWRAATSCSDNRDP
jgi:hypothetical protein